MLRRKPRVAVALAEHEWAVAWRARDGRIQAERAMSSSADLREDLAKILARVPVHRASDELLVAAVSPRAELRRLERLPHGLSATALTRIVRTDPRRFFPRDPSALYIGTVASHHSAHAVAAVERSLLLELADAGIPRVAVIPACTLTETPRDATALAIAALERGARSPWIVRDPGRTEAVPNSRMVAAVAAAALAAGFAFAGAPLRNMWQTRAALRELASRERERQKADSVGRALVKALDELRVLDAFVQRAPSQTLRLASFARNIERPTMLASLQLDSAGGSFVALTTRAADLDEMLADIPEIENTRFVGPIITEQTTSNPGVAQAAANTPPAPARERVTVRFDWARPKRGGTP